MTGKLVETVTAVPATGTESILAGILAEVMRVEQVPADSHFFDDLGADSLVMAKFCARVRKREDLPSFSMKDIYRHPTISGLAAAVAEKEAEADQAPAPASSSRRPAGSPPGRSSCDRPGRSRGRGRSSSGRQHAGVHRVRDAAAAVFPRLRLGGRARRRVGLWVDLCRIRIGRRLSAGRHVRRSRFCGGVHPADPGQVGPHRPVETRADPHLEPGLRPLLDRQDAGPVEPAGLPDRWFAALPGLPAGARRQNRAGHGDLLPQRAGVHRPAHHRPGHGDPQGRVLRLLPGARGLDPDWCSHPRPEGVRRREERARHRHVDGRRVAARPRVIAAQRPAGAGRPALARVSGPAHGPELRAGHVSPAPRHVPPVQVQRRDPALRLLRVLAAGRRRRVLVAYRGPGVRQGAGPRHGRDHLARTLPRLVLPIRGSLLRPRAGRPGFRGHRAPPAEPVHQAVRGLSAVRVPRPDPPGDRADDRPEVLHAPVR